MFKPKRASGKTLKILATGAVPIERLEERFMLSLLGDAVYPSNYAWNQSILNAPVASNSLAVINNIISYQNAHTKPLTIHPDFGPTQITGGALYGIPYNVVHGNAPGETITTVTISTYASNSDKPAGSKVFGFPTVTAKLNASGYNIEPTIEGDTQTGPVSTTSPNTGDAHCIVYDEDNNIVYEFDGMTRPSQDKTGTWVARGEAIWNLNTDSFRTIGWTSVDAAGLSVLAGLARPDEGLPVSQGGQGAITHALRFTLENADILGQFIYPASHEANSGNSNTADEPPMGSRFRLNPSTDISHMDPESKILAEAMETYGLILADNGSNFYISGSANSVDANNNITIGWNNNDINASSSGGNIIGFKNIPISDFQMVDLQPAVTSLSATAGVAGMQITINGSGFSGAAGHLSVLFGSVASTSVTVLSDTQVTATVPSESPATVDVTVQSGVADTGDLEDINNPVFGYGVSPVVTADRFIIQSPATISGRVFQDNNSDGIINGVDTGISGGTVYFDINNAGSFVTGDPTSPVNGTGNYSITGINPGLTGSVRLEVQPTGYVESNTSSTGATTSSGSSSTVNLAYFLTTYTGVSGNLYTLQLDSPGTNINVLIGATVTYSTPKTLPGLSVLTFNLGAGTESVTVNFANGNPVPSGGVAYNGGAGTDSLAVNDPTGSNSISVGASTISVNGSTITYQNADALTVTTGTGNDTLTQTAQPGNSATLAFTGGTGTDALLVTGGTFNIPSDPSTHGTTNLAVTVGGGANPATVTFAGNPGSGNYSYTLTSLTVSTNGQATIAAPVSGLNADRSALTTGVLSITGTGALNITDSSIDIHYGAGTDPSTFVPGEITSGAITSSLDDATHAVGYADGKDGAVAGLSSGDFLIRYTVIGDTNLDGSVNFSDLLTLASNYGSTTVGWDGGDFNHDGTVNFSDLLSLASDYGSSLSSPQAAQVADFSALWAQAQADLSAPVTHLVVVKQPARIVAGHKIKPPLQIAIEDASGNIVTTANSLVTIAIATGPKGAKITGTLTVQAVNGVATFDNLEVTKSGKYTFKAIASSVSPVLTSSVKALSA